MMLLIWKLVNNNSLYFSSHYLLSLPKNDLPDCILLCRSEFAHGSHIALVYRHKTVYSLEKTSMLDVVFAIFFNHENENKYFYSFDYLNITREGIKQCWSSLWEVSISTVSDKRWSSPHQICVGRIFWFLNKTKRKEWLRGLSDNNLVEINTKEVLHAGL